MLPIGLHARVSVDLTNQTAITKYRQKKEKEKVSRLLLLLFSMSIETIDK